MSEPAWMTMIDDDEADVYETLRAMYKDKTAFDEYPIAAMLAMTRAGKRLETELIEELPGIKIELLKIEASLRLTIFRAAFYMLGGWTQWTRALTVHETVFRGENVSESVAEMFVIDAVEHFRNRITKKETTRP